MFDKDKNENIGDRKSSALIRAALLVNEYREMIEERREER